MLQQKFAGSVLVNGSERRLAIDGNPLGRTSIQVDGVTVYDKKPFVHKETIDFDILPGKKATLRWQQVSLTGKEVDIIVDGRSTTLATIARDGSSVRPVGAKAREDFKVRAFGGGAVALGVVFLLLNYFELRGDGQYYPKYLFIAPLLIVDGLIGLFAKPDFLDQASPARRNGFIVLQVILLILCWFFKGWFLSTFGPQ